MVCWKGVCKAIRELGNGSYDLAEHMPESVATWSDPKPSPSYKLIEELQTSPRKSQLPAQIPDDLKDSLQQWKRKLMDEHADRQRKALLFDHGPEAEADLRKLIVLECGTGYRTPVLGDTVHISSVVTMEVDAAILHARFGLDYIVGAEGSGERELTRSALEGALVQMRRGERSSMKCSLRDLFEPGSGAISLYGEEALAVCEIKLCEIYHSEDCSFTKESGIIVKEVLHEGIGNWCDNPTDEGKATLRIEKICTMSGSCLFPDRDSHALELEVVVGNGQVCDALECALLAMRRHETATIICKEAAHCVGGPSLGIVASSLSNGARFRMSLLDYRQGPDVWTLDEKERLRFAYRRKVEANRLFGEGRFHLACERYKRIIELFQHVKVKDVRVLCFDREETRQQCRELCKHCRLNAAICSLRLHDSIAAKVFCDEVLHAEPHNVKGLFRRARACQQVQDYAQACIDLTRALDIDPNLEEARRLLGKSRQQGRVSDQKQCKTFNFESSVYGLNDARSTKMDLWNYQV